MKLRINRKEEEIKNGDESEIKQDWDSAKMERLVGSENIKSVKNADVLFEKSEWLTTKETAIYLRKFSASETPSSNAIHKLVARGTIRRRKFAGRLFFRKKELDFLIESSVS